LIFVWIEDLEKLFHNFNRFFSFGGKIKRNSLDFNGISLFDRLVSTFN